MPLPLDYGKPETRPGAWLRITAHLTLIYPLIVLGSLYGQYLLSWAVLGHEPGGPEDDPKYIDGVSWMHPITGILLMGAPLVGLVGMLLNAIYLIERIEPETNFFARFLLVLLPWGGAFAFLVWDPYWVLYWWLD